MALNHQWLDDPFEAGQGDYNATYWQIVQNPRFLAAINRAVAEYQENKALQQSMANQGHPIRSATPAQSARTTFLHEMNQDDLNRSGFAASAPPLPPPQ